MPEKKNDQGQPSFHEAMVLLILALGLLSERIFENLHRMFLRNIDTVTFLLYCIVAAIAAFVAWRVAKSTKELAKRYRWLRPLSKPGYGIAIGETPDGLSLHIPDSARTGHVQILGATGKGKTTSIVVPWICRDLIRGRSALFIDGKGDGSIFPYLQAVASSLTRPCEAILFDVTDPEQSCTINPLEFGTSQQITDRIFSAFHFDDQYYRAVQYDLCGVVVSLLHANGETVSMRRLHEVLSDEDSLLELLKKPKVVPLNKVKAFLQQSPAERHKLLSGLLSQLGPFAIGEVSALVNGPIEGRRHLNPSQLLVDKSGAQRVVVMLIPELKYPTLARQLGSLILQEIGCAVGYRNNQGGDFLPVFIDEFATFVYPGFTSVLNKARSSNVAMHLSHQSVADLRVVSNDFATSVNTNTNVKCILGINDTDTADFFARHMGTSSAEKITERVRDAVFERERTGEGSSREVEEFNVHPNRFKNYHQGHGVIHFPTAKGNVTEELHFWRFDPEELGATGGEA